MNIDRINSGVPLQRTEPASRNFDLTISDRGVTGAPVERSRQVAPQSSESQVTSSRSLQEVLSAEETRALRDSFPVAAQAGPSSANPVRSGVYGVRGTNSGRQSAVGLGGLVDLTG